MEMTVLPEVEETLQSCKKKKKQKKKEKEAKVVLEREYVVPLRRKVRLVPRYRRAKKAVRVLKEFIAKIRSCTCNKSSSNDINALKESEESKTK